MTTPVSDLIARSNRLGADPRNTNYAGGNTSAKGTAVDPVTGEDVELLWVKGSGGDLGTLTESGLAVLRLDRLRALVDVYPGVDREDEMVAAFDYCLHGKGGAAPSIDTAMHGLVDAAHVDHLHPDSGIAIATAADGEKLTQRVLRRPGRLGAVAPPRVPARARHRRDQGGEPAGDRRDPRWPRHHGVGRRPARSARPTRLEIIRTARSSSTSAASPSPSAPSSPATSPLPEAERHAKAAAIFPTAQFVRTLVAARLAADVLDVPTVLVARTDALAATLLTSDVDEYDREFVTGERTPEGFFRVRDGIDAAIARGLAYAPYADVIWCETSTPDIGEARSSPRPSTRSSRASCSRTTARRRSTGASISTTRDRELPAAARRLGLPVPVHHARGLPLAERGDVRAGARLRGRRR